MPTRSFLFEIGNEFRVVTLAHINAFIAYGANRFCQITCLRNRQLRMVTNQHIGATTTGLILDME